MGALHHMILVLAVALVASPVAAREVVLRISSEAGELVPAACGYGTALALTTGFDVREPRGNEPTWTARLRCVDDALHIDLASPDGGVVASKSMTTNEPCATAIEVLAILLAAHVPRLTPGEAATVESELPQPDPEPEPEPSPESDSDSAPVVADYAPTAAETPESGAEASWAALFSGGVALRDDRPRVVAGVGAEHRSAGLRFAGEVVLGFERNDVGPGSISTVLMTPRLLVGYALVGAGWGEVRASGVAGVQITNAWSRGIDVADSGTIVSAELGGAVASMFELNDSLSVAALVTATTLLPRPAFAVGGIGTVYETPPLVLEMRIGLVWRPGA